MGEVYLAEDPLLERPVAIKRITRRFAPSEEQRRRILTEAQLAAHSDPRIAAVHDVVEHDGEYLIIMEHIEGATLSERIAAGITIDDFWDVAEQCVEALQAAHREGLVHCDIKPDNIMITPTGQVKILDFGIASRRPHGASVSESESGPSSHPPTAGTPSYMAPEVHLGREADRQADIFSLGVVFYEMLARRRPFTGATWAAIAKEVLRRRPEPLEALNPAVSPSLNRVVMGMLEKEPARRYPTAEAVLGELLAARQRQLESTVPILDLIRRIRRWHRIRAWTLPAAVAIAVAVAVIALSPGLRVRGKRLLGIDVLPERKYVAVLPFEVDGDGRELSASARGLTEILTTALRRMTSDPTLQVAVPRGDLFERLMDPQGARTELGVNLVFRARLRQTSDELSVKLRLVDARSARSLMERSIRAPRAESHRLMDALVRQSADMLELPDADGTADAPNVSRSGAFPFFAEGVGRLRTAHDLAEIHRAVEALERAVSIDPAAAPCRAALARAKLRMYEETVDSTWLEAAASTSRQARQQDPRCVEAYEALGAVALAKKDDAAAIAAYEEAIRLDPTNDDSYFALGRIFARSGREADAEWVYRAAVDARPHCWRGYVWLGRLRYQQGRFSEAIAHFEKSVGAAPDYWEGLASLGGLYAHEGRYEDAIATLGRSIALKPSQVAFTNLAVAHALRREFDLAIETAQSALQFGFEDYETWSNLGDAYYWAAGKRELASEPYRRAIAAARLRLGEDPTDAVLLADLAGLFSRTNQVDSAAAYLEHALGKAPENPNVQYWAALVEWQLGRRDQALEWLGRAIANGYPRTWVGDLAVFDDWRSDPRFERIVPRQGTGPEAASGRRTR
jgi:serine/threonine-protein kinase